MPCVPVQDVTILHWWKDWGAYNGCSSTGETIEEGASTLLVIKLIPLARLPPGDKPPFAHTF